MEPKHLGIEILPALDENRMTTIPSLLVPVFEDCLIRHAEC
jgi:hypothetical protein